MARWLGSARNFRQAEREARGEKRSKIEAFETADTQTERKTEPLHSGRYYDGLNTIKLINTFADYGVDEAEGERACKWDLVRA